MAPPHLVSSVMLTGAMPAAMGYARADSRKVFRAAAVVTPRHRRRAPRTRARLHVGVLYDMPTISTYPLLRYVTGRAILNITELLVAVAFQVGRT